MKAYQSTGKGSVISASELEAQAWNWLRLLNSGDARELDASRFRNWVRTSPAHRAAYSEVKRRWDAIEPSARELLKLRPDAATLPVGRHSSLFQSRRAFLGAAVSAAAVAGIAVVQPPLHWWPAPKEWGADDRTGTGEQRTLALSAQVDITLNTRTSIRRHLADGRAVGLGLIDGEAAIDLKEIDGQFAVMASVGRSVADAGRFEVRNLEGEVCVTCIEGTVRVEHPAGVRTLQTHQQTVYDASSVSGVTVIDPQVVSAWRHGMLIFEQTRLAHVLEEINRYRAGRVILMNDAARARPVSGRFAIASLDLALWQLGEAFDLEARSLPAGILILS